MPTLMAIMLIERLSPSRMVMGPWKSAVKFLGRHSVLSGWGSTIALSR